jgi:hypothetical protein
MSTLSRSGSLRRQLVTDKTWTVGRVIKQIGDGSCLFRAIAVVSRGMLTIDNRRNHRNPSSTEITHIRNVIAQWMRSNPQRIVLELLKGAYDSEPGSDLQRLFSEMRRSRVATNSQINWMRNSIQNLHANFVQYPNRYRSFMGPSTGRLQALLHPLVDLYTEAIQSSGMWGGEAEIHSWVDFTHVPLIVYTQEHAINTRNIGTVRVNSGKVYVPGAIDPFIIHKKMTPGAHKALIQRLGKMGVEMGGDLFTQGPVVGALRILYVGGMHYDALV